MAKLFWCIAKSSFDIIAVRFMFWRLPSGCYLQPLPNSIPMKMHPFAWKQVSLSREFIRFQEPDKMCFFQFGKISFYHLCKTANESSSKEENKNSVLIWRNQIFSKYWFISNFAMSSHLLNGEERAFANFQLFQECKISDAWKIKENLFKWKR